MARTYTGHRCYACDARLGTGIYQAFTIDGSEQFVGRECRRKIEAGGGDGWQPPKGGPRLFVSLEAAAEAHNASKEH